MDNRKENHMEQLELNFNDDPQLDVAIAVWEEGDDIPFDLEADLLAKGYDVRALREQHMA